MKLSFIPHGLAAAALVSLPAHAHETGRGTHAQDHAPIGVMADHRHKTGEVMFSYRFMRMDMEGSRIGTEEVSPDSIVTTVPNRFFGAPGQPPTLRVVPLDMTMDMHMFGAMYGLTDRLTLMGMTSYISKDMDHVTYRGGMGTTVLGGFTTMSEGFGDTSLTAIYGLDDGSRPERQLNASLGLSLPTGSITETDRILTPMGGTPSPRLPYAMQLGTGSYDLLPAVTFRDVAGKTGYGAQASARVCLSENDEGYCLGDRFEATAWVSREPAPWISISARLKGSTQGEIDGRDPNIMAPVQTADPGNYGGTVLEALAGVNLAGQTGALKGHRVAAEIGVPLYRDLNGPQMETDLTFTVGYQISF